jgi:hypothetical protein
MSQNWKKKFDEMLPLLGHRNWILIADLAYPLQSRPGIETIATGEDHLSVAKYVMESIGQATHVYSKTYLDNEINFVPEKDAPGIDALKAELLQVVGGEDAHLIPHEDLIVKLDEAAKTFNVLVLKTTLTIPYTSVFLELDCGYWNPVAEANMRAAIEAAGG